MALFQWGDQEWGDPQWGEGDAVSIGDLVDVGGNALALPAVAEFIGFEAGATIDAQRNRVYEMHLQGIRDADRVQGGLFWKRFCQGPELVRKQLEAHIESIPQFWSVTDIPDEYVKLLLPQVGWGDDLSVIIDALDADAARRLVLEAVSLWRRRGSTGAFVEILNAVIGVDVWTWDYHDRKFILGQARLGQDESPSDWSDARFMNAESRKLSNLRITDAERTLDRALISELVKLWRPIGQNVQVTYVEFWDRFADDSKAWQTYDAQTPASTVISNKVLKLEDAGEQHAFPESPALLALSSYMSRARMKHDVESSYFGMVVGFDGDFATAIELRIYPGDHALRFYLNAVQLGSDTELRNTFKFALLQDSWHTMRVMVDGQFIEVFLDNVRIISGDGGGLLAAGTSGVTHGAGLGLQVDHFEIIPIPGENDFIGVNP